MKQYTIDVAGIAHTVQLSAEDAKRLGAEEVVTDTKQQATPKNKQAAPKNKADATASDS